ncbi:helix-turn-helix transcriptional regulator [Streptosporangium sp. NPDC051023]|uniref:helix-turn-helix domain-containing protein n=1 Tax=Streptosporangium sp. NPDC051023 TaxID=3155410 RepID=UPI0034500A30
MRRRRDLERAAAYVVARRGEMGLSRPALATAAGIDTKTLYNLESATRWPQAGNRSALEAALGWQQGDLAKIAEAGGEPTPPLVRPSAFEIQAEFPRLGVQTATAAPAKATNERRYPVWFIREADRRGVAVEVIDDSVVVLQKLANDLGQTLGELLLHVGLASEEDLAIHHRPISEARSEALAEYDESAEEDASSSFLSSRERRRVEVDAAARRKKRIEENP